MTPPFPPLAPSRRTLLAGLAAGAVLPGLARPGRAAAPPQRIVAVGGAVTETLFLLGEGERVVGADTTSTYPEATEALPKVGYMRRLSAEGLLSLRPDLVLAAEGAGPPDALETVARAGVRVETVPEARAIPGVVDKVRRIAEIVAVPERGRVLADAIRRRAAIVERALDDIENRPRVLFLMALREGALLSAGRETAAAAIIALAGGRNLFDDFSGYKPVSAESALARRPDYVLVMTHTAEQHGGVSAMARDPRLAGLEAVQAGRLVAMDGLKLLGFGPRTADAVAALARRLHGAAAVPPFEKPLEAL